MSTARPQAAIREELRLVEEDLAQLRETAASLRHRIGEREDDPTDPEERAAMIENADEQESLIDQLEARREELLKKLGGRLSGPGRKALRFPESQIGQFPRLPGANRLHSDPSCGGACEEPDAVKLGR
jgi:hypothetical protein